MSDATVNLGGISLTLTNAVQDTTNGYVDVYNEATLYALRSSIKNGVDLNNISTQVQRYGNDLKQVNSLASWQVSDWNDPTTAVQRTQALVDLGLLNSTATPPQVLNASDANVAFITNGSAISYSESILGVVAGNHLADIVGEPSAGANGNITFFDLPGGYQISWTGMRVTNLNGSRHYLRGIQPNVVVHRTVAGVRAGRDELLDRALALVKARMRGN